MHDTRSVLILGAGLGGMTAAQTLAGRIAARVYEPADTLEWLPNIHELVSGLKRPQNLRVARAPLLARAGHDWQRQAVRAIDARRHRVTLADGREQAFSHLIVAVGGARTGYPVPGVDEHAIRCRSVADGHAIALRLQRLAERAGRAPQVYRPAAKPQLVTFGDMDTFLITPAGRVLAGPALATLRELIYQVGLASFDRRRVDRRAWALWRRMLDSGIDGTITLLRHPGVLRGWPRFRVLES